QPPLQPDQVLLHFTVEDTGIGIPSDKLKTIFEPFTQADSSTTRKYGGTGLGLSISARLVGAMSGAIWVESQPGKGSRFHFTAALAAGDSAESPTVVVKAPDPVATLAVTGLQILLVEDNLINQRVARGILEKSGHHVTIASNGNEAIDAVER